MSIRSLCADTGVVAFHISELLSPFAIERIRQGLEYGEEWLESAPTRLEESCKRFGVLPTVPQWGGNRSVACRGVLMDDPRLGASSVERERRFFSERHSAGSEVVVKLSAYRRSTHREVESLAVLSASGRVPHIVSFDVQSEVLITHLLPDVTPLSDLEEDRDEAPAIAELLREVHSCDSALLPAEPSIPYRLASAWQSASAWRSAPRMELAKAAETLELMGRASASSLHGDLVPANVLRDPSGTLFVVDPQAAAGDPSSAVASWGLLRGNGDEQGWRAGGGAIRRALLVGSLLSCPSERVLAHLSFQAFEIACRQASWEQWDWVAESIELGRRSREMLV